MGCLESLCRFQIPSRESLSGSGSFGLLPLMESSFKCISQSGSNRQQIHNNDMTFGAMDTRFKGLEASHCYPTLPLRVPAAMAKEEKSSVESGPAKEESQRALGDISKVPSH